MPSKYTRLPLSYFSGKHVKLGFPYYEDHIDYALHEEIWVKVTGTWGNWLVGTVDDGKIRRDLSGAEIHFLREDVIEVLGATR